MERGDVTESGRRIDKKTSGQKWGNAVDIFLSTMSAADRVAALGVTRPLRRMADARN